MMWWHVAAVRNCMTSLQMKNEKILSFDDAMWLGKRKTLLPRVQHCAAFKLLRKGWIFYLWIMWSGSVKSTTYLSFYAPSEIFETPHKHQVLQNNFLLIIKSLMAVLPFFVLPLWLFLFAISSGDARLYDVYSVPWMRHDLLPTTLPTDIEDSHAFTQCVTNSLLLSQPLFTAHWLR